MLYHQVDFLFFVYIISNNHLEVKNVGKWGEKVKNHKNRSTGFCGHGKDFRARGMNACIMGQFLECVPRSRKSFSAPADQKFAPANSLRPFCPFFLDFTPRL